MFRTWLPEPLFEIKSGSLVVTLKKYKITQSMKKDLNRRQQIAIDYLLEEGNSITNMEYRQLNPDIKRATALNDLKELVDTGILSVKGKGKYTYYILS
jgi:ATP-dependent DNA helicase RecG